MRRRRGNWSRRWADIRRSASAGCWKAKNTTSAISSRESLTHEKDALDLYRQLLTLVDGRDVMLEEYARRMIAEETMHMSEVDKMLRMPGDIQPFSG